MITHRGDQGGSAPNVFAIVRRIQCLEDKLKLVKQKTNKLLELRATVVDDVVTPLLSLQQKMLTFSSSVGYEISDEETTQARYDLMSCLENCSYYDNHSKPVLDSNHSDKLSKNK